MQLTYMDWDPRLVTVEITSDGVYEFTLTQNILDTAKSKGGFIIVGHGFYLKKVSIIETQEGASGLPWTGHLSISWSSPESDPGHFFNVVPNLLPLEELKVGNVFKIKYSIVNDAEYHELAISNINWDEPYFVRTNVSEAGELEFEITQEIYDNIQSTGGFIIIGHGYYLDMVSVQ